MRFFYGQADLTGSVVDSRLLHRGVLPEALKEDSKMKQIEKVEFHDAHVQAYC